jgi:hypothetical protein
MVGAKMWARRLIVAVGVLGFGAVASAGAYQAAGVATSLGSVALAR